MEKPAIIKRIMFVCIPALLIVAAGLVFYVNFKISQLQSITSDMPSYVDYHFAMVSPDNDNPYWDMVIEGARLAAKEQGAIIEKTGDELSEDYDINDRLSMAICEGVDGIMTVPAISERMDDLFRMAADKEIPVIALMENDNQGLRSGYAGINSYEQGKAYGELLASLSEKDEIHNVVLVSNKVSGGEEGTHSGDVIYSSIVEYINTHDMADEIDITVQTLNTASVFNSKRDMQSLLSRESRPDVVICTDINATMSSAQTLVEKNLVGKVYILGSYVSPEILDYIQKGTIFGTIAVDPYELGEVSLNALIELSRDGRTNDYMPLEMLVINKENVADYEQMFEEE